MSVMSIRIADDKRRMLKAVASLQNKTISGLVESLIDRYIRDFKKENEYEVTTAIMKLSEPSFNEWDNPEDEIYDNM